jgi:hypothetical protein
MRKKDIDKILFSNLEKVYGEDISTNLQNNDAKIYKNTCILQEGEVMKRNENKISNQ